MTHPAVSSTQGRVVGAIARAASRTGVDFDYLMDQARVESGMRPDARADTSSATGLYQFTKQTWFGTVKQHGAAHGLGWATGAIAKSGNGNWTVADPDMRAAILDLRTNPEAAAAMAAEFAADNGEFLQSRIGGNIEPVDLYLAHFLGAEGAGRFLGAMKDDPEQPAAPLFPAAASANRAIFYRDDGSARSLSDIRSDFARKLGSAPSRMPLPARHAHSIGSRSTATPGTPPGMAQMEPMPGRLDLDFARNAYRRLSGLPT
ncbi:MAG: lytic transglycosylase domain-containing protein [Sphingomonadaceae bacterium]|nr:lytic transglycosylase domain-containing protein [Sphingomonadaceae bacterium]